MNRIILKQMSKEKEKKKKQPKKLTITQSIIQDRTLRHFQYHIGEDDKTTSEEIFSAVMGFNSNMIDSYAKFYWFDIITKVIRKLRRENKCFIIKKDSNYFVLKTLKECSYYKKLCNNAIDGMEKAKVRAENWVENEKWKTMKIPANEEVEDNEDEEDKEVIEDKKGSKDSEDDEVVKINKYKDKLKTKVIKLWK